MKNDINFCLFSMTLKNSQVPPPSSLPRLLYINGNSCCLLHCTRQCIQCEPFEGLPMYLKRVGICCLLLPRCGYFFKHVFYLLRSKNCDKLKPFCFFPVPPETVIVPILCSIIIFPVVAASAICLLRYYNQRARAKDRFRYVTKLLLVYN